MRKTRLRESCMHGLDTGRRILCLACLTEFRACSLCVLRRQYKAGCVFVEIQEILEKVKNGAMSVEEAEGFLRREPFEEMGYAKLDMHRKVRSGFAEVIYCAGKADEHLLHIFERLYKADGQVF